MDISNIWVTIGANIEGLLSGLNTAQNSTANAAGNMSNSISGISGAWAAAAAGAGVFLGAVVGASDELHRAQNQLQASLGLTGEQAKELGGVVRDVFANNFGDSMTEIGQTLATVRGQMQGLGREDLQGAVENAYRLRDVFGLEVGESVGAAKTLMAEFGLSQKEAFDFIAKGLQDGLNASGDFLDTIGEYSNQFAGAKLSASEFYSTMQTGLKGGALGTDKIADSIKEFGIRIVDGSKSSKEALGSLNLSWNKLSEDMASGKLSKADVLKMVQDRLRGTTDLLEQNAIGTALFGTQWEDLGAKAILSVDLQKTGLADIADSASELDVKYSDLGSALTGIGRKFMVAFAPIGDAIVSLVNAALPLLFSVANAIGGVTSAFAALPEPIQNVLTALGVLSAAVVSGVAIYGTVGPMLAGMGISFTSLSATVTAFTTAVRASAISVVASISSVIWPVTLVVAAIAGLYLAYRNNFLGIRDFLKPVIDNISKLFAKIVESIRFVVYNSDTLWKGFVSAFRLTVQAVGNIVKSMGTMLSGVGLILYAVFIEPWVPVMQALQVAGNNIASGLQRLVTSISNTLKPVFDLLTQMGIGVGAALQSAMSSASAYIGNIFGDAAGQISNISKNAASQTNTLAKGITKVGEGFNQAASAIEKYKAGLAGVGASTVAALKTPPAVTVPNAKLPQAPVTPVNTPAKTGMGTGNPYSGADPSSASGAGKGKSTAAPKAPATPAAPKAPGATQPYKATAADVKALSTEITRLVQDQKKAITSGKLTEDQAVSYKRKIEDLWAKIDKLNLENNKYITGLYGQAKGHVAASFAAAKASATRAAADAAELQRKKELEAVLTKLSSNVKDYSDADLAAALKRVEGAKAYGFEKKREIILAEQAIRLAAKQDAAFEASQEALEAYGEAVESVAGAIASMDEVAAELSENALKTSLDNRMNLELEAAGDNEAAKLEIKKKYAPQLLAIEEQAINAESNAKAASLGKTYFEALAIANQTGQDTTKLTASYLQAREALNANSIAQIEALRVKSAADIAKAEADIEKERVAERIRINTEAATTIADAYLESVEDMDTAGMKGVISSLEALREFYAASGESGVDSVIAIDKAINSVSKSINSKVTEAIKGFGDMGKALKPLADEFDDLIADPNSKDSFIKKGISGFNALIAKYDELIESGKGYADTLEGAGDKGAADAVRAEITRLEGVRAGIEAAKGVKSTALGTEYDTDKVTAIADIDNGIKANQLNNATEVADFKLKKLQDEKAAKLSLATTDRERAEIELSYVDRIKTAQLEALEARKRASDEAFRVELSNELAKEGLSEEQKTAIKANFEEKKKLATDAYEHERSQIQRTANEAEKSHEKQLKAWKEALGNFVKDMAGAVSNAYKTIYENTQKLNNASFATPEDRTKAIEEAAKANGEAAKNAGVGIFNAATTALKAIFPQFALVIDTVAGLLGNMPQLGVVFQRIGEIFLVLMDALTPVIEMLATVLEPLLNIFKVLLETVLKPLLPVIIFFMKVTATVITAIYNIIKNVWNAIANFLNGINILGWKPFNVPTLPELEGAGGGSNTPSVGSGTTGGNGSGSSGGNTENKTTNVTIYVNEAADADKVARLVERRIIKALA